MLRARAAVLVALTLVLCGPRAYADGPPPSTGPTDCTPPLPSTEEAKPAAEPAPAPAAVEIHPRYAAFVAAGVAAVGIGVGTAYGVMALSSKSSFQQSPSVVLANTGNEQAVISDVGFGVALIAGVTSVLLFLKNDVPSPPSSPTSPARPPGTGVHMEQLSVTPMISSHGGGAGAILRF